MRPEDNADAHQWAEEAYNRFRADDRDIADIADHLQSVSRPDGRIGFSAEEIEQVKRHVMVEEHFLGYDQSGLEHRRFSASPDVAEAWIRLREGRFEDSDLVLLEHELTEASYLQARPDASFLEAHSYANLRHNWDAREVRRSGEDLDVSWPRPAPDELVSAAQGLDTRGDVGPSPTDGQADPGAGVADPHHPADGSLGPEHRDPSTSGQVFVQPREPLPLRHLIPQTEAEVAERGALITDELRRVFAPDQDFGGLRVRLSERTDPISLYRGSVHIRVEIVHLERGNVGHATYSLERDARGLSAKIVNIHLAPDVRGHGFMRDFHQHLERWYAESGPVRIELRATGLGRIVHALTGVAWDPDAGYWSTELGKQLRLERTAAVEDHTVVQHWLDGDHSVDLQAIVDKHGIADPARLASSLERQIGAADAVLEQARRHPFGTPGHPSPWAFVRAGWEDGQRIPDHSWIGRRAMERIGEWRGVKEIEALLDRPSVGDVEGGRTDRFTEFADRAWLRAQRDESPIRAAVDIAVEGAGGLAGEDPGARLGALEHPDAFRDRLASEISREPGPEHVDAVTPTIRYVADLPPERFEHAADQIVDSLTARGYRPLDDLHAADAAPLRETRWYDGSSGRTFELHLRADESRITVGAGRIDHTRFVPDGRDPTVEGPVEAEKFGAAAEEIVARDFADRSVRDVRWENDLVRVELADGRTQFFRPAVGHGMDSVAEAGLRDGTEERPHLVTVNDRVASDQFTRAWVHEITHALQEHTGTTPETIVRRGLRRLAFFGKPAGTAADDPHVAARVNERRYLERLYETARSRDGRAELRRDIEGLDRDLKNLGYPIEKLPRLAVDEPALRLRSGQPTEPPASKDLPGGQRLHLRGDGRWHLELDEPDSYRGENGRLYLDRDPPHFYRDDSAHLLHHDFDQPDTFRDERTFHLRDISSGDRVHDPLDDLPVSHRATPGAQVDHASMASPAMLGEAARAAADRAAYARDVVQPLLDELGVPDRLENLHDDALTDLARDLGGRFGGDPERVARIADLVGAARDYHETHRDAVSAAEHDVAIDAATRMLAERDIEADAVIAGGWRDRLPIVAYDHANDRLVVIEPGRVAGTRYALPDHTIAQRGTPEYLRDLLLNDQRLYGAIAERPEVADPLRWAVERGELTVEYHRLGIAQDGQVWSRSLGTHQLDVTDLATRVPRDSGGLDVRARTRVEKSVGRVADALDRIGNPDGRKIEVLDDATVTMTSGSHTSRVELTFTDAVPERYLVDRAHVVVTDEGFRIELDHRAVDRLGADELDRMVTRAFHKAEELFKHSPWSRNKRWVDRPARAGSLVRDPVVPKKLRGHDAFEVTHLRTLFDRLPAATGIGRQHLELAVQRWIEEHGLREGMVGASERRHLIDPLLSTDAASRLDDLRTIEHAADPAVATVRKALHESTTWNLGVDRSTAKLSAVRLPDRDMFRLRPEKWKAEGRAGVTFQIKSGKLAHDELAAFKVSRLRSHYVLTVNNALGDMRAADRQYVLRRALSRALEGIVAEQEKRPPDVLNRRIEAWFRNVPIVSSSGGWTAVELLERSPFKFSVKTHITNAFDVATNNRFQVGKRIDAIEALQDLVLSAGLDEIGTHRDLQRVWLDFAWKDVEEMARLASDPSVARHVLLDLSDPPKSWQPLSEAAQVTFRATFRNDIVPALQHAARSDSIEGVRDVVLERRHAGTLPWRGETDAQLKFTWHDKRVSHVGIEVVEFTGKPEEVHVDYRPAAIVLQVPKGLTEDAARATLHDSLRAALKDIAKREQLLLARDVSLGVHIRRAYPDVGRGLIGAYPIDQVAHGAGEATAAAAGGRAFMGAAMAHLDSRLHIPLDEIQYLVDQRTLDDMSRDQQQGFGRTILDIATAATRVTDLLLEQATGQHQSLPAEVRHPGDLTSARDATSEAVAKVVSANGFTVLKDPVDFPGLSSSVDAYRLSLGKLNHVDVRFSFAELPSDRDVQFVRVSKGQWLIAVRPDGDPAVIRAESERIIDAITFARTHGALSLGQQLGEGGLGTLAGGASAGTIFAATHFPPQLIAAGIAAGFRTVRQMFEYRHELALIDARLAMLEGRHELLDVSPARARDVVDTLRGRVENIEGVADGAGQALARVAPDLAEQVEHVDGGFGPVPAKWEPLVTAIGQLIQAPEGLPPDVRLTPVPDRPHVYQVEFSNNRWRLEFATFEPKPGFAGDPAHRHLIVDSDVSNVVVVDPRHSAEDIARSLRAWLKGEVDGNGGMASGYQSWRVRGLEGARDTSGQIAAGSGAVISAVITHDPLTTTIVAQAGFVGATAINAAANMALGARHEGHTRVLGDRWTQHARERGDNASSPHLAQFTGEVSALNNRMWQAYDRMQHYARIAATLPEADRPPELQRWIDARSGGGGPAPGGGSPRPPDPGPRPAGPGPGPHGPGSGSRGTGPSGAPGVSVTHPVGADWTRIDEQAGGVVAARTAGATGAAAAEMLSHGSVSQDRILQIAGENSSADAIVTALNAEATGPWRIGPVGPTTFDGLVLHGQWIASLTTADGGTHYVVVDGLTDTGLVRVRDPFDGGSSYSVDPDQFKRAWTGESMYRYDPPTSPGDEWTRGVSLSRAAEMLSSGAVEHAAVIDHAGVDADPAAVASAMTDLTGNRWVGGSSVDVSVDLLTRHGPWAAEVIGDDGQPRYVLVEGRTDDGHLLVRDEDGAQLTVDRASFDREWTGQALLPEDPVAQAAGHPGSVGANGGPDGSPRVERRELPFGLTWKRIGVGVGLAALGALWYYRETQTAVPPGVPSPGGSPPSGGAPPTGGLPPPVNIPPPTGGTALPRPAATRVAARVTPIRTRRRHVITSHASPLTVVRRLATAARRGRVSIRTRAVRSRNLLPVRVAPQRPKCSRTAR